jgi:hypothetical protein
MKHPLKFLFLMLLVACLFALPVVAQAKSNIHLDDGSEGTKFITNDVYTLKNGKTLNGQLIAIDSTVTLEPESTVNGSVVLISGSVDAAGRINGSLICMNCSGKVLDTAVIYGSIVNPTNSLEISSKARISGSTMSGSMMGSDQDNSTKSETTDTIQTDNQSELNLVSKILGAIFVVLALSALGVLVALLFPKSTERIAHASTANAGISWGVGILSVFIVFIGMLILSITVILIPVAALAALVLGIAVLFGWIAFGYEIGVRIAATSNQKWAGPVAAGVGLLIMNVIVVGFVIIPSWVGTCISTVLIFVISMFGLGAVVLTRFGSHVYPETPIVPAAPAAPIPPVAPIPPAAPIANIVSIPSWLELPQTPPPMPANPPALPEKKKVAAKKVEVKKPVAKTVTTKKTIAVKVKQPEVKPKVTAKKKTSPKVTPKTPTKK